MSDDRESAEPVTEARKPYQFTVRTFFAVAVWLGLLLAAVTTIEEEGPRWSAVLCLAWIGSAELYRRFRATRALAALGTGPVVLLALWSVLFVTTRGALPPVSVSLMFAFGWGIVLSVVVIVERGVGRWVMGPVYRWRHSRAREGPGGPTAVPSFGRLRYAATLFALHTALALIAILISLGRSEGGTFAGMVLVYFADFPIIPVYDLMPGRDPPDKMPAVAVASLLLGGVLYAATGWLVAYLAERLDRRARAASPPEGASREVSPTPDGRDA